MRAVLLALAVAVLAAAPAEAHHLVTAPDARAKAREVLPKMAGLVANPAPEVRLHRCRRLMDPRWVSCRFTLVARPRVFRSAIHVRLQPAGELGADQPAMLAWRLPRELPWW